MWGTLEVGGAISPSRVPTNDHCVPLSATVFGSWGSVLTRTLEGGVEVDVVAEAGGGSVKT